MLISMAVVLSSGSELLLGEVTTDVTLIRRSNYLEGDPVTLTINTTINMLVS